MNSERAAATSLLRRWGIGLALLAVVPSIVGLYVVDQSRRDSDRQAREMLAETQARDAWARYDSAVGSCERGNVLRVRTNEQGRALKAVSVVLAAWFDSVREIRLTDGRPLLAQEAVAAQLSVTEIARGLQETHPVVCEDSVVHPGVPRPPSP